MQVRDQFFIGGTWVDPVPGADGSAPAVIDVIDPATEEPTGRVPAGTAADVDAAVTAARAALPGWSATSADDRAKYLTRLSEALQARQEEVALLISSEVGTPIKLSRAMQTGNPVTVLGTYAQLLAEYSFEERIGNSLVVKEPIGVVGAITPWNYPLHQVVAKVAAAWAAGCTVVLKPSEVAPLSAFVLAELCAEVGFPAGVFNLVTGYGQPVGEALAAHPDVDMISFTGSTRAGQRVSEVAAGTVKRVALELGGKSANVILDDLEDADFGKAIKIGVANAFLNAGQTCTAWTRMLVPAERHDEAVALAVKAAEGYTVGAPTAEGTKLGPLANAAQLERVRGYIARGVEEGAVLATGGAEPVEGQSRGYYVRPTVFAGVRPGMTIEQEEIFGPVLSVIPYASEDEAVEIANDTAYGLAGAVWSADPDRAISVARRMKTGMVDINGGRFNPRAPFGGFKQSGNGRELGEYGLEEFLEVKAIQT